MRIKLLFIAVFMISFFLYAEESKPKLAVMEFEERSKTPAFAEFCFGADHCRKGVELLL